jgi:hypothetical protein
MIFNFIKTKILKVAKKLSGIFLLIFFTETISGQPITSYTDYTGWGIRKKDATEVIILRKFEKGNHSFYLTLSPQLLINEVIINDSISIFHTKWEEIYSRYSSSPYIKALKKAATNSKTIQDAGFTRFGTSQKGIDLTIDLCPSLQPLDRIVFTDLIKEFALVEKPVPVAISVTGRWMIGHPDDLNWLVGLVKSGNLSIVWINHSFNHTTVKDVPLVRNFMLASGTDINSEVLNTEVALLERNIVPSVFFRFPGLVSNQAVFDKILSFGLIPVGSDAWLAKGQWPKNGSIVLIHANGNEPFGINKFIELLKNEKSAVLSRHWELFDLRESIVNDESK